MAMPCPRPAAGRVLHDETKRNDKHHHAKASEKVFDLAGFVIVRLVDSDISFFLFDDMP
jgi:hypothetical protein